VRRKKYRVKTKVTKQRRNKAGLKGGLSKNVTHKKGTTQKKKKNTKTTTTTKKNNRTNQNQKRKPTVKIG